MKIQNNLYASIGSLKIARAVHFLCDDSLFQSLIGSLKMAVLGAVGAAIYKFQSLIGSLRIKLKNTCFAWQCGFNPS